MVRIIDYGNMLKRPKRYYKIECRDCHAELVFEKADAWCEDPLDNVFRIECPVCRSKVFFTIDIPYIYCATEVKESEYEHAHRDASKSGLQMLKESKEKE